MGGGSSLGGRLGSGKFAATRAPGRPGEAVAEGELGDGTNRGENAETPCRNPAAARSAWAADDAHRAKKPPTALAGVVE